MKIVITGSLGNISKPLTIELVQKRHSVTVISSKADRQNDIEALGAKAAIGTIDDVSFLTKTFMGADIVYLMEPPFHLPIPTLILKQFGRISHAATFRQFSKQE